MEKKKQSINEVADINGSKVFIENGEVKTVLNEAIQKGGYMTVKELRDLLHASINKQEEMIRNGNEEIQRTRYMSVEEARSLSHAYIDKLCELYNIK